MLTKYTVNERDIEGVFSFFSLFAFAPYIGIDVNNLFFVVVGTVNRSPVADSSYHPYYCDFFGVFFRISFGIHTIGSFNPYEMLRFGI